MAKKVSTKSGFGKVLLYLVLTIIVLYTIAPLFLLFVNAFKPQSEIITDPLSLPQAFSFSYLLNAMEQINYVKATINTALITFTSVALILVVSSLAAWMMVRNKTKSAGALLMVFTAAMLIPFQSVMYPLISVFEKIGLKNSAGLVLMYGGFGLSMSVFLYHGFIKSVPKSIEEAALMDGANIMTLFFTVVFPLLKSTTATVIILNSMWIWNDYLLPFLVIGNSSGVKTLTLELYVAKLTSGQYGNPWELIFPAVFATIIPIIIVFLFLQKYIVKGVSEGAVKQ